MKAFSYRKLASALDDPRIRIAGVAEIAGLRVQTLYTLRDGKAKPYADTVAALAFALNKPIDFFYEEAELVKHQQLLLDQKAVANG